MTQLVVDLPAEAAQRLQDEAVRLGKPAQDIAREWLVERLSVAQPKSDREAARRVLRDSGLLAEKSDWSPIAGEPPLTLEEIQEAIGRAGGKPLSEILLDQRGRKG